MGLGAVKGEEWELQRLARTILTAGLPPVATMTAAQASGSLLDVYSASLPSSRHPSPFRASPRAKQ